MSDAHSITPGGLATDASGRRADMPRRLVHRLHGDLLDVLTLLYAAKREVPESDGQDVDQDGITDASCRTVALIRIADDKVRRVLESFHPYV